MPLTAYAGFVCIALYFVCACFLCTDRANDSVRFESRWSFAAVSLWLAAVVLIMVS